MRTLLICHDDAPLDRDALARWLSSFSTLTGIVVIREPAGRLRKRIAREIRRVGWLRFLDVMAYRAFHTVRYSRPDREWEARRLEALRARYPGEPDAPVLDVQSPNSPAAETFIRAQRPDLVVARCKTLLAERVFSIPPLGTFVMHPGICPEYRNAHGCFWALASNDPRNVGMTLLRIDRGVDTGPVFGYFRVEVNDDRHSHVVVQHRAVLDHLDDIARVLLDIEAGRARPISTEGRKSAAWGQPWLTAYLNMRARRRLAVAAPHQRASATAAPREAGR